jgi:hypothetical protein
LGEERVAETLGAFLREGLAPLPDAVQARLAGPVAPTPTGLAAFSPNLAVYDALITEAAS